MENRITQYFVKGSELGHRFANKAYRISYFPGVDIRVNSDPQDPRIDRRMSREMSDAQKQGYWGSCVIQVGTKRPDSESYDMEFVFNARLGREPVDIRVLPEGVGEGTLGCKVGLDREARHATNYVSRSLREVITKITMLKYPELFQDLDSVTDERVAELGMTQIPVDREIGIGRTNGVFFLMREVETVQNNGQEELPLEGQEAVAA